MEVVSLLPQRAAEVNADPMFCFDIVEILVFGSFVSDADELGDIDLVCQIERRYDQDKQDECEELGTQTLQIEKVLGLAVLPRIRSSQRDTAHQSVN
jgi:predicted nucleotidyltransferase